MTGSSTNTADTSSSLDLFEQLLPAACASGDRDTREAAFGLLRASGWPHRRMEDWKYTDVAAAVAGPFTWAPAVPLAISGAEGLRVLPLRGGEHPDRAASHPFALLNRAFANGGWSISVPDGVQRGEPVELRLGGTEAGALVCPAVVLQVGEGSRVDVVLRCEDSAAYSLASLVVDVRLARDAAATFTIVRSGRGSQFANLRGSLAERSRLVLSDCTFGGAMTRNDLHVALRGEDAELELNGLFVIDGEEHVDHHTTVEHAVANARSRQLYKGVIAGTACGVFNGRIVVQPGASGTDAYQMNRTLLRSRTARINTKPQLEISNDDVRCSHGATIGRMDELQRFYLASRGIDPDDAETLLVQGFAGEVIDRLALAGLRDELRSLVGGMLGGPHGPGEGA